MRLIAWVGKKSFCKDFVRGMFVRGMEFILLTNIPLMIMEKLVTCLWLMNRKVFAPTRQRLGLRQPSAAFALTGARKAAEGCRSPKPRGESIGSGGRCERLSHI